MAGQAIEPGPSHKGPSGDRRPSSHRVSGQATGRQVATGDRGQKATQGPSSLRVRRCTSPVISKYSFWARGSAIFTLAGGHDCTSTDPKSACRHRLSSLPPHCLHPKHKKMFGMINLFVWRVVSSPQPPPTTKLVCRVDMLLYCALMYDSENDTV